MSSIRLSQLRCEYLSEPLGLDIRQPRLSWILKCTDSARLNVRQSAYQIIVTRESGEKVWDSRRVKSDETAHIVYAGKPLEACTRYEWKVRAWDEKGVASPWSKTANWTMGFLHYTEWQAKWIGPAHDTPWVEKKSPPSPMLRKEFAISGKVKRAIAYVSALGVYEFRLNGQRVGDHILAPEWTDYHRRVQYQAYDVTEHLRAGKNAMGAVLGQGWYAGRIGLHGHLVGGGIRAAYGHHLKFILHLAVEMADGKKKLISSDLDWTYTTDGPIRGSDLLDGETYDARREIPGWDRAGFDDSSWKKVTSSLGPELVMQRNEPIRITRMLAPIAMTEPKRGVYIIDLGQNMVGWARIKVRGNAGQKIRFRYAEVLNPDGTLYRDNLRNPPIATEGAMQEDHYICKDKGDEIFEPHFTYHGFRYVEITGYKPQLDDLTGCVFHSSCPETAEFRCSSNLLNRIMKAIIWTQRGNLQGIPTDCPQRDERLGWMGDIQVFAQTACFNMDMGGFFSKWLQDVRDAQADDGRLPDIAPHPFNKNMTFSGNPGWGDAGVIVPWRAYVNYGDVGILEENFEAGRRWIAFILRKNPNLLWQNRRSATDFEYGDWLNADTFIDLPHWPKKGGLVPKEISATMFFAHSTGLMARIAKRLGRKREAGEYEKLAKNIQAAFLRAYVSKNGKIKGDTQAGYALALSFDLLPAKLRPLAVKHLIAALKPYKGSLSTGFISTVRMMNELTRYGHSDEAYHLVNKTTQPSWGYMVENGGTTIWERWDGWAEGRGFQNPGMNSFNHYAIGAVGEWMWRTIIGLNPDESAPGWKHFLVRPIPGGGLTSARGKYQSIRGTIAVDWKIENGIFKLNVDIPCNTTANVQLPGGKTIRVGSGRRSFSRKLTASK